MLDFEFLDAYSNVPELFGLPGRRIIRKNFVEAQGAASFVKAVNGPGVEWIWDENAC